MFLARVVVNIASNPEPGKSDLEEIRKQFATTFFFSHL